MKLYLLFFFVVNIGMAFAQTDIYQKRGVAIEGYDVVAYFDNEVKKGKKAYSLDHGGTTFLFANSENLTKFEMNPDKFLPQYGGYCAYAVAIKGKKVKIDPETYELRDGKLYLFYNAWGTNTLKLWQEEGAEKLQRLADENWERINDKG